jgi:hypothetical protein
MKDEYNQKTACGFAGIILRVGSELPTPCRLVPTATVH